MPKGLIRLCYRKVIDKSCSKAWDRYVFEDTYKEFYMQAQSYNPNNTYHTFQEIVQHVAHADRLHYLTSRAAVGYIRQLNQQIPDILNTLGKRCLPFTKFTFEIIQSDLHHQDAHKVAIHFYSDPITWLDSFQNTLLIAYGDQREAIFAGNEVETDLIELQPYLSISTFQPAIPA